MDYDKESHIVDNEERLARYVIGICVPIIGPIILLAHDAAGKSVCDGADERKADLAEATEGQDDDMFQTWYNNRGPGEDSVRIRQKIVLPGGMATVKTSTYHLPKDEVVPFHFRPTESIDDTVEDEDNG